MESHLPYLLALGAVVLAGVSDFLYKRAHEHESSIHEASFLCIQSGVVVVTLVLLSAGGVGWTLTGRTVWLGLGCGLLAFVTAITVLYAVGRGPVSTTTAVRRLSFLITGLLAIAFLGERMSLGRAVGIALAVAGVLLMAVGNGERQGPHPVAYVALVVTGLLAFGHKLAALAGVSPSAFLICQAGTVHLCSHALCRAQGGYRFTVAARRYAPVTGTAIAGAMVLAVFALRRGDALVIVPLLQLSFLVTAPLGLAFTAEPLTGRKVAGIAVGAAAVLSFGLLS